MLALGIDTGSSAPRQRLKKADAVAIRILHVHLAGAPGLVNGTGVDRHAFCKHLRVKRIETTTAR
jgi:hypothetical protein